MTKLPDTFEQTVKRKTRVVGGKTITNVKHTPIPVLNELKDFLNKEEQKILPALEHVALRITGYREEEKEAPNEGEIKAAIKELHKNTATLRKNFIDLDQRSWAALHTYAYPNTADAFPVRLQDFLDNFEKFYLMTQRASKIKGRSGAKTKKLARFLVDDIDHVLATHKIVLSSTKMEKVVRTILRVCKFESMNVPNLLRACKHSK